MKSLQEIEDYYVNQGLTGDELRTAIEGDGEYKRLLLKLKDKLGKTVDASNEELQKYVLSTAADYEILSKIHQLEKQNLSSGDKELVQLIKTQLELDWRSPIVAKLDELLQKYRA